MIKLAGDLHANREIWKKPPLSDLGDDDYVIGLGDSCYIYGDDEEEHTFLDWIEENVKGTLLLVQGNHDNIEVISSKYPEEDYLGGRVNRIRKNIVFLKNGYILEIPNDKGKLCSFYVFGGARSIDIPLRGSYYWPAELPSDEEKRLGNENLTKCGWKVDYILSHTLPINFVKDFYFNEKENPLNQYLQFVKDSTEHKHWYAGHIHESRRYEEDKLTILGICEILQLE